MQRGSGDFAWVHAVLQVRDSPDTTQQPVIVCTNQVLDECEASVMVANSWLYHYYSVQSKIQFGMPFEGALRVPPTASAPVYYHHHHTNVHHTHHHQTTAATATPGTTTTSLNALSTTGTPFPTLNSLQHHHHHYTHHHHQYHHMNPYGVYHSANIASGTTQAALHVNSGSGNNNNNINGINPTTSSSSTSTSTVDNQLNANSATVATTTNVLEPQHFTSNYNHGKGTEPVDYSQVNQHNPNSVSPTSSSLQRSTVNSSSSSCQKRTANVSTYLKNSHTTATTTTTTSPPPPKKRARNKIEPLYLQDDDRSPDNQTELSDMESNYQLHTYATGHAETHASVIYASVVPTRPRLLNKSLPPDPGDFIDQWNPSPPWSESAQKVSLDSFSSSHELSPCITTTPPTPTSAPPQNMKNGNVQTIGPAFSFEWMSDQLVPLGDSCISCLPPDGIPVIMAAHHHTATHAHTPWPTTLPPGSDHHHHITQHLAAAQSHHQQHHQHQHHHNHQQQHQQQHHQQQQQQHQQLHQQHQQPHQQHQRMISSQNSTHTTEHVEPKTEGQTDQVEKRG